MTDLELPVFEATASKDFPGFLIVWCPRDDCVGTLAERPFVVHKRTWMRPYFYTTLLKERSKVVGRPCPYCFRASKLPTRLG